MLRALFLTAPFLCGFLLSGHAAQGAPRRARQIGAGLFFPGNGGGFGGGHQITHVKTKKSEKVYASSSALSPGGYTGTVHASPFLSSGGYHGHSGHLSSMVGSSSNLFGGGLHSTSFSTGGLHGSGLLGGYSGFHSPLGHHTSFSSGGLHGGYLGGMNGFHTPMTATGHLLLGGGGYGGLGHHMSGYSTGNFHGGAYGDLMQGPLSGGLSSVTHHVSYSSGNLHQAAAEHQHLSNAAQVHTQLASQALAEADAAHNAQLQASLYHKQLLHKAMSHQTYAQRAQEAANTAHQRLLHESAAHAAISSVYHSGHGLNGMYGGGLHPGFFSGGLQSHLYGTGGPSFHTNYVQSSYPWQQGGHGLSMVHGGGFSYGTGLGTVAVQYPETQLQSVIRKLKHCTSIHYLDNLHGLLGSHHPLHGSPLSSSLSGYHYGTGEGFPMAGGFQHHFRR
ncbi:hypothetical protein HPB47_000223 [Ixodes persulcatus]|uniref:Uncharacterized protein n=1 Tax=Ixodes persulcatus TaxID=34615 RepID=A0AC60PSE0_IXOPE|nr:hypothetical protein HPB47_000223 [Ixodes persulcatus]